MRPLAGLARPQPLNIGDPPNPGDPNDPRNSGYPPGGGGEHPFGGGGGGGPFRPPGPGFDPSEQWLNPDPPYTHSRATPALRQAGYNPYQANQLIRLARHGGLAGLQGPGGAYHDPTGSQTYDPTPGHWEGGQVGKVWSDPVAGDERKIAPTDPGYYGGFKTPGVQQGLQAVAARWDARRARQQARRGP